MDEIQPIKNNRNSNNIEELYKRHEVIMEKLLKAMELNSSAVLVLQFELDEIQRKIDEANYIESMKDFYKDIR